MDDAVDCLALKDVPGVSSVVRRSGSPRSTCNRPPFLRLSMRDTETRKTVLVSAIVSGALRCARCYGRAYRLRRAGRAGRALIARSTAVICAPIVALAPFKAASASR